MTRILEASSHVVPIMFHIMWPRDYSGPRNEKMKRIHYHFMQISNINFHENL
jgi:hypothetical protein